MTVTARDPDPKAQGLEQLGRASLVVIGFCLAYVGAMLLAWPRLGLDPIAGTWRIHRIAPAPVMTFYGLLLWGLGGALLGALAAWPLGRWLGRQGPLLGLWAGTALLLALLFCTWHHWPWPQARPLP